MPPTDTGTQYAGLTPAERAAAMIDPHMQACDVLRIPDCRYCRARLSTIRQVLAAVAPVIRAQALTEAADAIESAPQDLMVGEIDHKTHGIRPGMYLIQRRAGDIVRALANPSTEESTE